MFNLRNENEVLECAEKIRADREAKCNQVEMVERLGRDLQDEPVRTRIGPTNEDVVSHHSPDREQIQRITTIRAAARNFLDAIDQNCGRCADATAAKRKVREAMMTANAAIVLNGAV